MDSQLKRGILNICILQLLKQEDQYGYVLIKNIQEYFPDTEESTLYAILRRMHKEGWTELYYREFSNGPRRKYYRMTEEGREVLNNYVSSWNRMKEILAELLGEDGKRGECISGIEA